MRLDGDYLASVPLALADDVRGVPLSVRVADAEALLAAADELDWPRVREVEIAGLAAFGALRELWRRAHWRVHWTGFDVGELLDHAPALRRRTIEVLVAADDPDLYEKLVVGDSLGLHMVVAMSSPDTVDLGALNELVTYVLLTGAQRTVHIRPVTELVKAAAGGDPYSLWDGCRERVHHDLWVSEDGRVGCSAARLERYGYGTLAELADADVAHTVGYRALATYAEQHFRDQTTCSTCLAFPQCGGWLRADDPDYDCEVWQLVLSALSEAVGAAERQRALQRHAPSRR